MPRRRILGTGQQSNRTNDDDASVPLLRWSSTLTEESRSEADYNNNDNDDYSFSLDNDTTSSEESHLSYLPSLVHFVIRQWHGIFGGLSVVIINNNNNDSASTTTSSGFCHSGLPWQGLQCRSKRAGWSGCLFILPTISLWYYYSRVASAQSTVTTPLWYWEAALWSLQAILSILADYVYIPTTSMVHGCDRCLATLLFLFTVARGHANLGLPTASVLLLLCVTCFAQAGAAKTRMDLEAWKTWHLWWHITAGCTSGIVVYAIHACPQQHLLPHMYWLDLVCQ